VSGVAVRGDRDGLIIALPAEGGNGAAANALRQHLAQSGAFFKDAAVTLDVGERALTEEELRALHGLLNEWNVKLEALRAVHEQTRAAARALEMALPFVVGPEATNAGTHSTTQIPEASIEALLVRRTLRSGQAVRHPGAVIVLGDVNPGAEIVAGSDVVVWGSLRGVVHAGAIGDDSSIVCALKLSPTQLRISSFITVAPEEKGHKRLRVWKRLVRGPELARIQGDRIVVEAWPGTGE
jgi:septum site-determining protein MinC